MNSWDRQLQVTVAVLTEQVQDLLRRIEVLEEGARATPTATPSAVSPFTKYKHRVSAAKSEDLDV